MVGSSAEGADCEVLSEVAIVQSMPSSSSQTGNLAMREAEALRYLDKWTKWTRKLLDHKFLRGYWSDVGHYLAHIKSKKMSRLVLR